MSYSCAGRPAAAGPCATTASAFRPIDVRRVPPGLHLCCSIGKRIRGRSLRITFFVNSVIGYVDNPTALYTRALADGLAMLGNDIRVVEERKNEPLTRTLHAAGAGASRHFYEQFPLLQYNSYEPRTGASLLEWLSREVSLIDIAVAVQGVDSELVRWIANISREGLTRAFLAWQPESIDDAYVAGLELERFDLILGPDRVADLTWHAVLPALAEQDCGDGIDRSLAGSLRNDLVNAIDAATAFERLFTPSVR